MEATRAVDDAQDKGTIHLVTYVYRPLKNDRHEVAVFSHGSTGGLARSPKEPGGSNAPPPWSCSSCSCAGTPWSRRCGGDAGSPPAPKSRNVPSLPASAPSETRSSSESAPSARRCSTRVIDQLVLGRLAPRDAKVLLVGHSRGGFLSLILAGERPALAKAVINFSGGWYGVTDRLSASENQQRLDDQKARLTRAAERAGVPTLWFYAARDPFYKEGVPQELRRYWQEAGGRAEFVFVAEHSLPNAHLALSDPKLWEQQADALLKIAETTKR